MEVPEGLAPPPLGASGCWAVTPAGSGPWSGAGWGSCCRRAGSRRGDQDAAGQMLQVRQVAHESLREMRAVVSGYRTADLGTELAGAQDVLRSAGMSCRVIGDAAGLPADVQAALGWVVREGTTNIIRHSDATACTIELHILDSPGAPRAVTLRMDNDRVHTPDAGSGGSGLAGLGERLAGLGGSITTRS